ncbi:hypothetical protein Vadar_025627 [Vaccinium darrowii]|uniref:Uncharacterized protein n=1 Tax=Vaccinium darrowii TaxID=229202 RepID=A0ACB7Y1S2_9ERIC|nr:hypothetical protein Vadar_025627 [Vaccinium darrowii]
MSLTRLFNETSAAMGGPSANPAKKQEIEDNSGKIGVVIAKLTSGDISRNATEKLVYLCPSFDNGDFGCLMDSQAGHTYSVDPSNLAHLKPLNIISRKLYHRSSSKAFQQIPMAKITNSHLAIFSWDRI